MATVALNIIQSGHDHACDDEAYVYQNYHYPWLYTTFLISQELLESLAELKNKSVWDV